MAIIHHHHRQLHEQTTISQPTATSFSLDSLYCEEETYEHEEQEEEKEEGTSCIIIQQQNHPLEHDMFFDEKELCSLFAKEQEQQKLMTNLDTECEVAREEAVKWMLKVNAFYGFTTLTGILAINYLDRFLCSTFYQRSKPWMIHLVAVTCLSLATKVEETHVPLLLDLQVEDTKYMFEAKTIQRMELLVLSSLKWKMHPVTPLSFLDHIVRRLGLKKNLHWDFYKRCENLLLNLVSDSRSMRYLPSVLATAAMVHIIDQVQPFNSFDHHHQLFAVLNLTKEEVLGCYGLIQEMTKANGRRRSEKRKHEGFPRSPSGVIEADMFNTNSESSNDSWGMESSSSLSCVFSSTEPLFKKTKTQPSQSMFVDLVSTSPH